MLKVWSRLGYDDASLLYYLEHIFKVARHEAKGDATSSIRVPEGDRADRCPGWRKLRHIAVERRGFHSLIDVNDSRCELCCSEEISFVGDTNQRPKDVVDPERRE